MKYNHVMRTSCLAALICLSLSAVSLANGPVTDSAKARTRLSVCLSCPIRFPMKPSKI